MVPNWQMGKQDGKVQANDSPGPMFHNDIKNVIVVGLLACYGAYPCLMPLEKWPLFTVFVTNVGSEMPNLFLAVDLVPQNVGVFGSSLL